MDRSHWILSNEKLTIRSYFSQTSECTKIVEQNSINNKGTQHSTYHCYQEDYHQCWLELLEDVVEMVGIGLVARVYFEMFSFSFDGSLILALKDTNNNDIKMDSAVESAI